MAHHQKLHDTTEDQLSLASIHYLRNHFQEATDIYKRCARARGAARRAGDRAEGRAGGSESRQRPRGVGRPGRALATMRYLAAEPAVCHRRLAARAAPCGDDVACEASPLFRTRDASRARRAPATPSIRAGCCWRTATSPRSTSTSPCATTSSITTTSRSRFSTRTLRRCGAGRAGGGRGGRTGGCASVCARVWVGVRGGARVRGGAQRIPRTGAAGHGWERRRARRRRLKNAHLAHLAQVQRCRAAGAAREAQAEDER
jgi:hypothetical protein